MWKFVERHSFHTKKLGKISVFCTVGTLMGSFYPKWKMYELKIYKELCVMVMKNDAKFEEEMTCHLKINMRNLTKFDPSTRKSQKFAL